MQSGIRLLFNTCDKTIITILNLKISGGNVAWRGGGGGGGGLQPPPFPLYETLVVFFYFLFFGKPTDVYDGWIRYLQVRW